MGEKVGSEEFLMYCSALALMATAVFTGSTISYGQENSEISDLEMVQIQRYIQSYLKRY